MRVIFTDSITYKVLKRIEALPSNVVLRSDIANIANPRQISRAINRLIKDGRLTKLGYGVYAKLARSQVGQTSYLKKGVLSTLREALTRLNIKWELSDEERDYQAGRSTQVPANPSTKLKNRFRRQLQYRNMGLKFG